MTARELLTRLEGVRPRGAGKWSACCPAHDDTHPSLAIAEGERGVLVKCWGGCPLPAITAALGLAIKDLFFETPTGPGQRATSRPARHTRMPLAFQFELAALDRRLRAARVFHAVTPLVLDALPPCDLDRLVDAVGQAYADGDRADLFEAVADDVRAKQTAEQRRNHAA